MAEITERGCVTAFSQGIASQPDWYRYDGETGKNHAGQGSRRCHAVNPGGQADNCAPRAVQHRDTQNELQFRPDIAHERSDWRADHRQQRNRSLDIDRNGEHTVRYGETLWDIARRHLRDERRSTGGTAVDAEVQRIVRLNQDAYPDLGRNPDLIQPGWKLRITGCDDQHQPVEPAPHPNPHPHPNPLPPVEITPSSQPRSMPPPERYTQPVPTQPPVEAAPTPPPVYHRPVEYPRPVYVPNYPPPIFVPSPRGGDCYPCHTGTPIGAPPYIGTPPWVGTPPFVPGGVSIGTRIGHDGYIGVNIGGPGGFINGYLNGYNSWNNYGYNYGGYDRWSRHHRFGYGW